MYKISFFLTLTYSSTDSNEQENRIHNIDMNLRGPNKHQREKKKSNQILEFSLYREMADGWSNVLILTNWLKLPLSYRTSNRWDNI